ncbi:MAG: 3-dehydroquinate synthase [Ignavibacteriaceae bacterium]
MKKLTVKTALDNYPVLIGVDVFNFLPQLIEERNLPKRFFVIVDENVFKHFSSIINKNLNPFGTKISFIILKASEKSKSLKTLQRLYTILSEKNFGRDTLIVAIGGGTLGDIAGFAASTYMRGVPLIHIPTTLLSCVDSSIGGKTAVNFKDAKNLIGTFYQPEAVLIDLNFLETVPRKEIISGLGEVVKYSYLTNGDFYEELLSKSNKLIKKDLDYLSRVIYECAKIKAAVISKDEKEISGVRKILNFGHTFAHAFESNSSYKISHGKAVLAGIISAIYLSRKKELISDNQLKRMVELPLKFKSFINLKDFDEKKLFNLMSYDKKRKDEKIKFVLIKNFGEILVDLEAQRKEIHCALKKTREVLI